MARPARGFTLIEIMVVLGVVAILALLTLPSFMSQYVRNQIVEALPLADIAKSPVAASWALAHALPADNAAAGLPVPEKVVNNHISALRIEDGAIHVTFGNRANTAIRGKVLSLRPAIVPDAPIVPVAWVCGYAQVPGNMTARGENRTSVPAQYLPVSCRAL